jgi:hypothetical protein
MYYRYYKIIICFYFQEIYCRGCYGKRFGLHGYGYGGFGSIPALTAGGEETRMEYHFTQFF